MILYQCLSSGDQDCLYALYCYSSSFIFITRFSFLDFKEYNTDDSSTGASPAASPYPSDRLSVDSSTSASDSSLAAHQQSPLLTTRKSLSSQLLVQNGCSSTGNSPQNLREKSSRLESYSSPTISISHDSDLASYDSHVETS